ncbi:MAG: hypothetical protein H0V25_10155 [Solirubrobacterales bacterium]|nr:hypothetical protein [Solirubrobacterales bacterium]
MALSSLQTAPVRAATVGRMRWDDLFADLEGQARALESLETEAEIADRIRVELGQVTLLNRLRAQVGTTVRLRVDGAGEVTGELAQVGADWLLLKAPDELIVPSAAVAGGIDLPVAAVSPEGVSALSSRLRLTAALRGIAVDRCPITVTLRSGERVFGTPDRVGADFIDVAMHERGTAPRRSELRSRMTLAFTALAVVRRDAGGWG